jgi:hypothetical protein
MSKSETLYRSFVLGIDAAHPRLQVVFDRSHDRYAHRVELCDESAQAVTLLESIEGDAEHLWPASPAIQEVHLEERPDGSQVALCVGMAGKSHWSLGVTLAADGREVVVQAACRVRELPSSLGSAYRVLESPATQGMLLDPSPTTLLQTQDDRRIFSPNVVESKAPQTLTWEYAIAIQKQ